MPIADWSPPDHLPVLSRGKHRNPRKGACFMEMASYLAGERWSDHPPCTHPLLSALARGVNDHTSDDGRQLLAPMIPQVIGLTSDDLHVDVRIALLCADTGLPVAAAERQRVLAVGVLSCQRVLAHLDGEPAGAVEGDEHGVEGLAPRAFDWARRFTRDVPTSVKRFRRIAAPSIVSSAVMGIAEASVPDPDGMLRRLLAEAISECRRRTAMPADTTGPVARSVETVAT
jgi:hypothetical protein